ncbi:colibactin self-protection protein ClbS [Samsonia erythrinae]|uniref:ClbS/DfsB family four-helix bundle protein n=1 Tax=Samsonia erythrinae TaxID=160434 RepID=A0A4R3VPT1_9GAMM|nr:colibactin self-protection protein ClbS [Samsonia erythrinae]TCV09085.1 hypothetical protein EDC54_101609 [Samsonia erythrinae]
MAVPESKDELIKAINSHFALLQKKLGAVLPEQSFEPTMEGHAKGSVMSVAQLVSYLIGWGELVLHWHEQEAKGETINFPEEGYKWNELGRLAQKFYRDYEDIKDYEILLLRLKENKQQLLTLIERFSNEELYGSPWYGKWTRGRMIQFNTSSPYKNASGRLNKLKKQAPI